MIYSDSRYADGLVVKVQDARRQSYQVSVFREFPVETSGFRYYTWVENDRLDIIAHEFLGDPNLWWQILDFNPEVINGLDIPVGTVLRIPSVL
jgi:nucleoid-associated protein YgaU